MRERACQSGRGSRRQREGDGALARTDETHLQNFLLPLQAPASFERLVEPSVLPVPSLARIGGGRGRHHPRTLRRGHPSGSRGRSILPSPALWAQGGCSSSRRDFRARCWKFPRRRASVQSVTRDFNAGNERAPHQYLCSRRAPSRAGRASDCEVGESAAGVIKWGGSLAHLTSRGGRQGSGDESQNRALARRRPWTFRARRRRRHPSVQGRQQ